MADRITLEIATPDRLVITEGVDEVVLPSADGYMGVRSGHAPLLARLEVGEISYRIGDQEKFLAVSGGFAEVLRASVEILAQTCEPAEEIDVERAEKAKQRAEARIRGEEAGLDLARAEVSLKKAISRLRVQRRGPG